MDRAAERPDAAPGRGSGGQGRSPEPRYLVVGLIVGAHGLRGELKVDLLTDDPHRFGQLERVYIGYEDAEPEPWSLLGYRLHRGQVLLQLEGCAARTEAEALRGSWVQVPLAEALPLGEDEYYEYQVVGLDVWTTAGAFLGQVMEVIYTGANDVYVVHDPASGRREVLIPAIDDVVLQVDLEAGRLVVALPDGLV